MRDETDFHQCAQALHDIRQTAIDHEQADPLAFRTIRDLADLALTDLAHAGVRVNRMDEKARRKDK